LVKINDLIEKSNSFMKSDKLGYLTTDPKYLGTSMQACMYLRLPKLSRELDEI
jgi:protein-arginine kinase